MWEMPQQQKKVEDKKQVDKEKPAIAIEEKTTKPSESPKKAGMPVDSVIEKTINTIKKIPGIKTILDYLFLSKDGKSDLFIGESYKNKIIADLVKVKRKLFTEKKLIPQALRNLFNKNQSYFESTLEKSKKLTDRYIKKVKKLNKKEATQTEATSAGVLLGIVPQEYVSGQMTNEELKQNLNDQETVISDELNKAEKALKKEQKKKEKQKPLIDSLESKVANLKDRLEKVRSVKSQNDAGNIVPINPEVLNIVNQMRSVIDDLSVYITMNDETAQILGEEKRQDIKDNLGTYISRKYANYTNKNWKDLVSQEVYDQAAQEIFQSVKRGNPEMSDIIAMDKAKNMLDEILTPDIKSQISNGIKNPKAKAKTDLSPKTRMLLGQYGDTGSMFISTVIAQAGIANRLSQISSFLEYGTENGFVFTSEEDALKAGRDEFGDKGRTAYTNKVQPEGEGGQTYYTTAGVAEELSTKSNEVPDNYKWLVSTFKFYKKAVGQVKKTFTTRNPPTHAINFFGNTWVALNNGHINLAQLVPTIQSLTKGDRSAALEFMKKSGLLGTNARLGEINDLLNKTPEDILGSISQTDATDSLLSKLKSPFKKTDKFLEEAYQKEDDFWKVYGFFNEAQSYSQALYNKNYKELTPEEKAVVEEKAVSIVKEVYPNWDKIPEGVRVFKNYPMASAFLSFTYESYRIKIANIKQAYSELESDNPKVRDLGAKRIIAAAVGPSIAASALTLLGTDDEELDPNTPLGKINLEKMRVFRPEWQKNSTLVPIDVQDKSENKKGGVYNYYDATASNPFGSQEKLFNIIKDGGSALDITKEVLNELSNQFGSGDIVTNIVSELNNNKNPYGSKIYQEGDEPYIKSNKMLEYGLKRLTPSFGKMISKGMKEGFDDLGMTMLGFKPYSLDMRKALKYKVINLKKQTSLIKSANEDYFRNGLKDLGYESIKDYLENRDVYEANLEKFLEDPEKYYTNDGVFSEIRFNPINSDDVSTVMFVSKSFKDYYDIKNKEYKNQYREIAKAITAMRDVGKVPIMDIINILDEQGMSPSDVTILLAGAQQGGNFNPPDMPTEFSKELLKTYSEEIKMLKENNETITDEMDTFLESYKTRNQRYQRAMGSEVTAKEFKEQNMGDLELNEKEYKEFIDYVIE